MRWQRCICDVAKRAHSIERLRKSQSGAGETGLSSVRPPIRVISGAWSQGVTNRVAQQYSVFFGGKLSLPLRGSMGGSSLSCMTLLQREWLESIDFFLLWASRTSDYDSFPRVLPNLLALEVSDVSPCALVDGPSCGRFEKGDLFFCLQSQW